MLDSVSGIDRTHVWHRARLVLLLATLAYLGFYVYGLIMGVFSAFELAGFTIAAAIMVAGIVAISLRARFGEAEGEEAGDEARKAKSLRERRGF